MSEARGRRIPYRYQLLSAIGSAVMLLGLVIYDRMDILPIQLPSQGYGIACVVVGASLIVWSGWLVYSYRLSTWRTQQQERKP